MIVVLFINCPYHDRFMTVKGLKPTSSLITISAGITESAANTFTSQRVDLQLNALDNEVFVVYAIDLDAFAPDNLTNTKTVTKMSVSTTERQDVGGLDDSNVLATKRIEIQNVADTCAAVTEYMAGETPAANLPYIGIIATNDFYLNIDGDNNTLAKSGNARLWGMRMKADSSVYAALVQSELLSA